MTTNDPFPLENLMEKFNHTTMHKPYSQHIVAITQVNNPLSPTLILQTNVHRTSKKK